VIRARRSALCGLRGRRRGRARRRTKLPRPASLSPAARHLTGVPHPMSVRVRLGAGGCCLLRCWVHLPCPAAAGYRLVPSTGSPGAWQLMRCRAESVRRRRRHMPPLRRSPRVRFGSQARGATAPSKLSAVQTAYGQARCALQNRAARRRCAGRACSQSTSPMRAPGRFGVRRGQCLAAASRAPVPHAAARRQHPSRPALSQAELARTQRTQARRRA
jgi:hypothetical protein